MQALLLPQKLGINTAYKKMKSFGKAQAFAITLEKQGGSATPTMDKMVVMGKL